MSTIISFRNPPVVGWVAIDEFENLFAETCNAVIAVPGRRSNLSLIQKLKIKSLGPFTLGEIPNEGELLLVVARKPSDLSVLRSIPSARSRFKILAGYVIDSYFVEDFGSATADYDHVFCTSQLGVDVVRERFSASSSVLRQGFDCLNWACLNSDRSIDLIGFGRQPPSYHLAFQDSFHRVQSQVLYLHSPIGAAAGKAVWDERPMMLKLMQQSKLSLAFHLLTEPQGERPRESDFVTTRWLESLACGCIVVGKRPPGPMADEMLCWPNATIELSDNPREASREIACLISNRELLRGLRRRNVVEMYRRHDWRHRIQNIYSYFGLQTPENLSVEIARVEQRIADLDQS